MRCKVCNGGLTHHLDSGRIYCPKHGDYKQQELTLEVERLKAIEQRLVAAYTQHKQLYDLFNNNRESRHEQDIHMTKIEQFLGYKPTGKVRQ